MISLPFPFPADIPPPPGPLEKAVQEGVEYAPIFAAGAVGLLAGVLLGLWLARRRRCADAHVGETGC